MSSCFEAPRFFTPTLLCHPGHWHPWYVLTSFRQLWIAEDSPLKNGYLRTVSEIFLYGSSVRNQDNHQDAGRHLVVKMKNLFSKENFVSCFIFFISMATAVNVKKVLCHSSSLLLQLLQDKAINYFKHVCICFSVYCCFCRHQLPDDDKQSFCCWRCVTKATSTSRKVCK